MSLLDRTNTDFNDAFSADLRVFSADLRVQTRAEQWADDQLRS